MIERVRRNLRWARAIARLGLPASLRAYAAYRGVRWPGGARWAACFTFDLDYEEDERALPSVLDALAATSTRASFACIGTHVGLRPGPYRDIASAGHEIVNHSMTHPFHKELSPSRHWNELSRAEVDDEVRRAHEVLSALASRPPVGFRAPHFERNATQGESLAALGYAYDSSGLHAEREPSDGLPVLGGKVPEVPIHRSAGTWGHFRAEGARPERWEPRTAAILDAERRRGGLAVFCLDPQDVPASNGGLRRLLDRARDGGAWVGTMIDVIRHIEAAP